MELADCFVFSVVCTVSLLCPFLKGNVLIRAFPLVSFWNCPLAIQSFAEGCAYVFVLKLFTLVFSGSHIQVCVPLRLDF